MAGKDKWHYSCYIVILRQANKLLLMPLILLRFAIISMGNNAGDTTQAASASFDLVINDNLLQFDFGPRVIGGSILTCSIPTSSHNVRYPAVRPHVKISLIPQNYLCSILRYLITYARCLDSSYFGSIHLKVILTVT